MLPILVQHLPRDRERMCSPRATWHGDWGSRGLSIDNSRPVSCTSATSCTSGSWTCAGGLASAGNGTPRRLPVRRAASSSVEGELPKWVGPVVNEIAPLPEVAPGQRSCHPVGYRASDQYPHTRITLRSFQQGSEQTRTYKERSTVVTSNPYEHLSNVVLGIRHAEASPPCCSNGVSILGD